MKKVLLKLIRFYQKHISSRTVAHCRFYPTCSAYCYTAIERFGVLKGLYLGIRRLSKCHPYNVGGVDFVPDEFKLRYGKNEKKEK